MEGGALFAFIQIIGGVIICILLSNSICKKSKLRLIVRSFFFMYGLFTLPIAIS